MYEPERVRRLKEGTAVEDDRDAARYLVDELKSAITRGARNPQGSMGARYRELYTALQATTQRLGIAFKLEHDSLGSLVKSHPELPSSWPSRVDSVIDRPFARLLDNLDDPANLRLLEPVEPSVTGWAKVDREIKELRGAAAGAATGHERAAVARLCREVLVSLADAAYDEQVHGPLPQLGEHQGGGTVKARLQQVINTEARGRDLKNLRGLMNKTLNFANSLQHHKDPDDVEAMICADATIMVATGVGRLVGSAGT